MARLTISLGRCGFCEALAARFSPLAGDPARPARICRACASRFTKPPQELPPLRDISEDIAPSRFWRGESESETPPEPTDQVSVGDVLRAFRRGVERVLADGDHEARYHLGIAFFEMGLLEEAIEEFEIAAREPDLVAECRGLIGICFRAQGFEDRAIESFAEAIKTPGTSDKQKAAFFFELAVSLEAVGERRKAGKMLQQVRALDPNFPRTLPRNPETRDLGRVREAFGGGGSRDAYFASQADDSKGGIVRDAEVLEASLRAHPENVRARITLAGTYVLMDRATEAANHYLLAAIDYRREGSRLKAVASYEMVLRIGAPGLIRQAHTGLADLCAEMGTLEGDVHRRKAAETGEAPIAQDTCSFCGLPPDFVRPPARSSTTTICSDCLFGARDLFARTLTG